MSNGNEVALSVSGNRSRDAHVQRNQTLPHIECRHCGKLGHMRRDCPDRTDRVQTVQCFRCHQIGHTKAECPELKHSGNERRSGADGRDESDLPAEKRHDKEDKKVCYLKCYTNSLLLYDH